MKYYIIDNKYFQKNLAQNVALGLKIYPVNPRCWTIINIILAKIKR